MIVSNLRIHNFLSIGFAELNLHHGLHLIEGVNDDETYSNSNGSGKSSLIEALYWSMFGDTLRETTADGVVNWKIGKDCQVDLEFLVGQNLYWLSRYRQSTVDYHPSKNGLELYRKDFNTGKWVDMTAHRMAETQEQVAALLDITPDVFRQTVILEGGLKSSFSSMTDAYRKQFLEEITGLEVWEHFQKESGTRYRTLKGLIEEDKRNLVSAQMEHRRLRETWDEFQKEESSASLRDQISAVVESAKTKIAENEQAILDLSHRKINLLSQESTLSDAVANRRKRVREWSSRLETAQREFTTAHERMTVLQGLVSTGRCPTCEQDTTGTSLSDKKRAAEKLNEEKRQTLSEINDQIHELEVDSSYGTALEGVRSDLLTISTSDQACRDKITAIEAIRDEKIEDLEKRIKAKEKQEASFESLIETAKTKVQGYTDQIAENSQALDYAGYWKDHAPAIRAKVMESVLTYLNDRLKDYSYTISDGDEVVELSMQSDKIKVETLVNGTVRRHGSRSSGERRRTDLCIQFAMNDLSVTTSSGNVPPLLILDEVLDTLDATSISRVLTLLDKRVKEHGMSVFVTTHNPEVRNHLPEDCSVMLVRKENGISTVVTG